MLLNLLNGEGRYFVSAICYMCYIMSKMNGMKGDDALYVPNANYHINPNAPSISPSSPPMRIEGVVLASKFSPNSLRGWQTQTRP